jgi:hypothetical protein
MDPVIIAFALLLGTVLISRLLLIKGLGLLNSSEQSKVTVMFSKNRIWNLVVMLGFAALYYLLITFQSADYLMLAYIYLGIIMAALFLSTGKTIQQFKKFHFNATFIRYFAASNIVRGIGIMLFFVFILNTI